LWSNEDIEVRMSVVVHAAANEALAHACESLRIASADAHSPLALMCVDSPLGTLLLGAHRQSVAALEFCDISGIEDRVSRLQSRIGCVVQAKSEPVLEQLIAQLDAYFARTLRTFDLPLTYNGSHFQQQVWTELLRIPYGQTCSYGTIAQRVGDPGAMRAVGAANHHNPIAIVIPCHRVVNAKGDIGGYGGEVWRKRWLLDLEAGQSQFAF
jgi:O-6-methylguanine DNA methyltransferase